MRQPDIAKGRPSGETGALQIAHGAGGDDSIVADPAVRERLRYLRDRYGYLTRAELGEPVPRSRSECPGEFDARGRLRKHCPECAA